MPTLLIMKAMRNNLRAFTLAESLIASVVLAAAVIGIAGSLSASYQQSEFQEDSATALDLARELMEDVSAMPFDPPGGTNAAGWPTVTDRTKYDTIDDYNNYQDVSDATKLFNGTTKDVANAGGFTRTVGVVYGVPAGLTGNTNDFAMVSVTVQAPNGRSVKLQQLCTRVTVVR